MLSNKTMTCLEITILHVSNNIKSLQIYFHIHKNARFKAKFLTIKTIIHYLKYIRDTHKENLKNALLSDQWNQRTIDCHNKKTAKQPVEVICMRATNHVYHAFIATHMSTIANLNITQLLPI